MTFAIFLSVVFPPDKNEGFGEVEHSFLVLEIPVVSSYCIISKCQF